MTTSMQHLLHILSVQFSVQDTVGTIGPVDYHSCCVQGVFHVCGQRSIVSGISCP